MIFLLQELKVKQTAELARLKRENLSQYAIKGTENDWESALSSKSGSKSLVSVKTADKRVAEDDIKDFHKGGREKKKKKRFSKWNFD